MADLIVTKTFTPSTIVPDGTSELKITITNPAANGAITGIEFSDTYPVGIVNQTPPDASSTMGGSVGAVAGVGSLSFSGGSLAAGASGEVVVDVTGSTLGVHDNATGEVTTTQGFTGPVASADLTIAEAPPTPPAKGGGAGVAGTSGVFSYPDALCYVRRYDITKKPPELKECPKEISYPSEYGKIYELISSDSTQCCYKLKPLE